MLIGIVGKSGSGKSFLAQKIAAQIDNSIWIDIDKIGHDSLIDEDIKTVLNEHFGNKIMDNDMVNRKKLSDIVFGDGQELNFLNQVTEKYIKEKIQQIILNNQDKIIILDWALLTATDFFNQCDIKILVQADKNIRKQRIIDRDKVNIEKFEKREKASYDYNKYNFDFIVDNNKQLDLARMVNKIYEKSYISG